MMKPLLAAMKRVAVTGIISRHHYLEKHRVLSISVDLVTTLNIAALGGVEYAYT
jgi:hypothetical protein